MTNNQIKIIVESSPSQACNLLDAIAKAINEYGRGLNYFEIVGVLEEAKMCLVADEGDEDE